MYWTLCTPPHKAAHLWRVLKAAAPGKRQWWRGCWGRDLLAGSVAPGMRSTGMQADNSVTAMSNSLQSTESCYDAEYFENAT